MSLTQLIASSPMDAFLYGDPAQSSFKKVFSSTMPYAVEMMRMDFSAYSVPGRGTLIIPRKGDMLMGIYLQVEMQRDTSTNDFFPIENLIETIQLEIGGQIIEKYDNNWIRARNSMLIGNTEKDAVYTMENFETTDPNTMVRSLWIQLPFWFNTASKALPLIALQYHEVRLEFTFASPASIPGVNPSFTPTITAWGSYAFLSKQERLMFTKNPHAYIFEQTQTQNFPSIISTTRSAGTQYTLPFNLPVKYLLWFFRNPEDFGIYTGDGEGLSANDNAAPLQSAKIQVNGVDRFDTQIGSYFRLVEPYRTIQISPPAGMYAYYFATNPLEKDTVSGTLNFSAVDTVKLIVTTKAASAPDLGNVYNEQTTIVNSANLNTLTVIARSLNILRVEAGMGGLMFQN